MNKLDSLKQFSEIVADTGDIEAIKKYRPSGTTTNPSLLLKAVQMEKYDSLVQEAIDYGKTKTNQREGPIRHVIDRLFINFGAEILNIIPGKVSTEIDARLSFDTDATVRRTHELIQLYEEVGVDPKRVLIKIASTWEGIQAARRLEKEGIQCNMTLLFSLTQAVLCADAGATLVSPFVGRILDWYKKNAGVDGYLPHEDPGVKSVGTIFDYMKKHKYETVVMGASFRNVDQILELAGCDLLTISPSFLEELTNLEGEVPRKLDPRFSQERGKDKIDLDEKSFRWELNQDAMATEKLAEGIRLFSRDTERLERRVREAAFA